MNNTSLIIPTPDWGFGKCDFSTHESRIDVFLFLVITVTTLFGNIVVFISYSRYRSLRNKTNVFLISLSASDMLVAIISIPLTFGVFLCNLRPSEDKRHVGDFIYLVCDMLPSIASIYSLTLVAVDKAIAVTHPFSHKEYVNQRSAPIAVAIMWVYVATIVSLILILSRPHFTLFIIVMAYILPVTIMIVSYMLMGYVAKKHAKAINAWERTSFRLHGEYNNNISAHNGSNVPAEIEVTLLQGDEDNDNNNNSNNNDSNKNNNDNNTNNKRKRSKRDWHSRHRAKFLWREFKAAMTLLLLLVVFVISWTPFMALNIEHYRCQTCHIDTRLVKYFKMLHYSNSALNPILYVILSKSWRSAFRMVLCVRRNDGNSRNTYFPTEMRSESKLSVPNRKYSAKEKELVNP